MDSEPSAVSSAPPAGDGVADMAGDAGAVFCPGCGYDLRGATSDRCTECGLVIDRAAAAVSGVPWAHRRQVGRIRAFVKTVWFVTVDARRIRHEMGRPQDLRDAGRFRACNAACVAAALLGVAALFVITGGLEELAIQPFKYWSAGPRGPLPGYLQDAAVPWSAGVTLVPAIPIYLVGLAVHLAALGRALVRLKGYPPAHRQRARAMALYATAPLTWLAAAVALWAAAAGVALAKAAFEDTPDAPFHVFMAVAAVLAGLALAAAVLGTVHRTGQWVARAHHAGPGRYFAAVAELLGRSILGFVLFLGVIPWCVGLAWIIVDSFR